MVFSIWNEKNICLSWKETEEYSAMLGLETVPVLYKGPWDENMVREIHKIIKPVYNNEDFEGYVVRVAGSFSYGDFRKSIAKWVRHGHVQTHRRGAMRHVVKNQLKTE